MSVVPPLTIYFDLLDTVRTSVRPEETMRSDKPHLPTGQLMLSILCGETPVFATNQSIDSSVLLNAMTSSPSRPYFRSLVENGRIRFLLYKQPNILSAFKTALEGKFIFSAWPEIDSEDTAIRVERSDLLAYIDDPRDSSAVPETVRERVEALKELSVVHSEAAEKYYRDDGVTGFRHTLTKEIELALKASQEQPQENRLTLEVEKTLGGLVNSGNTGSDRSAWYAAIYRAFNIPPNALEKDWKADNQFWRAMEAKAVVDLCNNNLTSLNLGVKLEEFTAKENKPLLAIKNSISRNSISGDILDAGIASNLEAMSWEDVTELLMGFSPLKGDEILKKLAKKVAIVRVGNQWRYKIIPRVGYVGSAFVSGVVGGAVRLAGGDWYIALGASGLVSSVSAIVQKYISRNVESWLVETLAVKTVEKLEIRYHSLKGSTEE